MEETPIIVPLAANGLIPGKATIRLRAVDNRRVRWMARCLRTMRSTVVVPVSPQQLHQERPTNTFSRSVVDEAERTCVERGSRSGFIAGLGDGEREIHPRRRDPLTRPAVRNPC